MFLIVIAGSYAGPGILERQCSFYCPVNSDTVTLSLQALFYELSTHQNAQKKLQKEIDEHFSEHDEADPVLLAKLSHLQACINESLRLWPPVPSGAQRVTPPEGLQVGDTFLPGDTLVQVPQVPTYHMHRSR